MDLERNTLGLGRRPALLLVDMIRGFTDPACPLGCDCPEVVAANATLLREFHSCGLPVFFTTTLYRDDSQARVFRRRIAALNVLTPDSDWVQVDPRLDRQPGDELIEKQWASAFHRTDLDALLRAQGVDSLVVTGLTTSGQELLKIGERIYYAERIMNGLNGFHAPADDLPQRFFKEAGSSGNNVEIRPIDRNTFLSARDTYYRARGLDADGWPTEQKATELGLSWKRR